MVHWREKFVIIFLEKPFIRIRETSLILKCLLEIEQINWISCHWNMLIYNWIISVQFCGGFTYHSTCYRKWICWGFKHAQGTYQSLLSRFLYLIPSFHLWCNENALNLVACDTTKADKMTRVSPNISALWIWGLPHILCSSPTFVIFFVLQDVRYVFVSKLLRFFVLLLYTTCFL